MISRIKWERIQQIFEEASELPPAQREEWLKDACGDDQTLYLQVESLLTTVGQESGFLEKQIASYATRVATAPPEHIGPYRIVSEIGHGGMGAVYLAQRADQQYERQVAIKVIRSFGAPQAELLRRFRVERQILANLQHPNIAQMLDGDVTDDGIPYLVMEYVNGVRIDEYCDRQALSVRQRIALFQGVCAAVEHAHRNLVVHRDIKPGNILVTEDGTPKLLDFGIAKLLQSEGSDSMAFTALTAPAERPRTPEYASPEQINGGAITTSTDVYALGIVLYELLTGHHPFADFRSQVRALEQATCETEPRRPSDAGSARTSQLKGDLDSIVLKAIRKEPEQRYASVEQLSEDLGRYLDGFPVVARRGTRRYRAGKFIRRHRFGVAAATTFVVMLMTLGTALSLLSFRLAREKTRSNLESLKARQAQQTAEAVNHFLQEDVLAQASASHQAGAGPNAKADPNLTVRTALDRAASSIEGKFTGEPLVEAGIRRTIGQAYSNLGLLPQAIQEWERATYLLQHNSGMENAETLDIMRALGDLYMRTGRYPEAQQMYVEVLQMDRRVLGQQHPVTIGAMYSLGVLYTREGNFPQAESLLTEALQSALQVSGEMDSDSVGLMRDLASLYSDEGKYELAEPLFQRALKIEHRMFGPDYNDIIITKLDLGRLYLREGRFPEAEQIGNEALDSARRTLGNSNSSTAVVMSLVGDAYLDEGKYSRAQDLLDNSLALYRHLFGDENPNTLTALSDMAAVYEARGRYAEAEQLYSRTLEIRRRVSGDVHPSTLRLTGSLAALYEREGKYKEAETLFVVTSKAASNVLGRSHPETLSQLTALGRVQLREGRYDEAEATLRSACDAYRAAGADTWQRYYCESLLGRSLAAQKKYTEGSPLEVSGYQGMLRLVRFIPSPDKHDLDEARPPFPGFSGTQANAKLVLSGKMQTTPSLSRGVH